MTLSLFAKGTYKSMSDYAAPINRPAAVWSFFVQVFTECQLSLMAGCPKGGDAEFFPMFLIRCMTEDVEVDPPEPIKGQVNPSQQWRAFTFGDGAGLAFSKSKSDPRPMWLYMNHGFKVDGVWHKPFQSSVGCHKTEWHLNDVNSAAIAILGTFAKASCVNDPCQIAPVDAGLPHLYTNVTQGESAAIRDERVRELRTAFAQTKPQQRTIRSGNSSSSSEDERPSDPRSVDGYAEMLFDAKREDYAAALSQTVAVVTYYPLDEIVQWTHGCEGRPKTFAFQPYLHQGLLDAVRENCRVFEKVVWVVPTAATMRHEMSEAFINKTPELTSSEALVEEYLGHLRAWLRDSGEIVCDMAGRLKDMGCGGNPPSSFGRPEGYSNYLRSSSELHEAWATFGQDLGRFCATTLSRDWWWQHFGWDKLDFSDDRGEVLVTGARSLIDSRVPQTLTPHSAYSNLKLQAVHAPAPFGPLSIDAQEWETKRDMVIAIARETVRDDPKSWDINDYALLAAVCGDADISGAIKKIIRDGEAFDSGSFCVPSSPAAAEPPRFDISEFAVKERTSISKKRWSRQQGVSIARSGSSADKLAANEMAEAQEFPPLGTDRKVARADRVAKMFGQTAAKIYPQLDESNTAKDEKAAKKEQAWEDWYNRPRGNPGDDPDYPYSLHPEYPGRPRSGSSTPDDRSKGHISDITAPEDKMEESRADEEHGEDHGEEDAEMADFGAAPPSPPDAEMRGDDSTQGLPPINENKVYTLDELRAVLPQRGRSRSEKSWESRAPVPKKPSSKEVCRMTSIISQALVANDCGDGFARVPIQEAQACVAGLNAFAFHADLDGEEASGSEGSSRSEGTRTSSYKIFQDQRQEGASVARPGSDIDRETDDGKSTERSETVVLEPGPGTHTAKAELKAGPFAAAEMDEHQPVLNVGPKAAAEVTPPPWRTKVQSKEVDAPAPPPWKASKPAVPALWQPALHPPPAQPSKCTYNARPNQRAAIEAEKEKKAKERNDISVALEGSAPTGPPSKPAASSAQAPVASSAQASTYPWRDASQSAGAKRPSPGTPPDAVRSRARTSDAASSVGSAVTGNTRKILMRKMSRVAAHRRLWETDRDYRLYHGVCGCSKDTRKYWSHEPWIAIKHDTMPPPIIDDKNKAKYIKLQMEGGSGTCAFDWGTPIPSGLPEDFIRKGQPRVKPNNSDYPSEQELADAWRRGEVDLDED